MDQSLLHKLSHLGIHKLSLSYKLSFYRISREEEDLEHYKNPREKSYKIQASNLSSFNYLPSSTPFCEGPGDVFIASERRI